MQVIGMGRFERLFRRTGEAKSSQLIYFHQVIGFLVRLLFSSAYRLRAFCLKLSAFFSLTNRDQSSVLMFFLVSSGAPNGLPLRSRFLCPGRQKSRGDRRRNRAESRSASYAAAWRHLGSYTDQYIVSIPLKSRTKSREPKKSRARPRTSLTLT